ncbi:hypothetical protein CH063_00283, partial [Colletotrichum higginsianum]
MAQRRTMTLSSPRLQTYTTRTEATRSRTQETYLYQEHDFRASLISATNALQHQSLQYAHWLPQVPSPSLTHFNTAAFSHPHHGHNTIHTKTPCEALPPRGSDARRYLQGPLHPPVSPPADARRVGDP